MQRKTGSPSLPVLHPMKRACSEKKKNVPQMQTREVWSIKNHTPQWPNGSLGSFFSVPVHFLSRECFSCIESFSHPILPETAWLFLHLSCSWQWTRLKACLPPLFFSKSPIKLSSSFLVSPLKNYCVNEIKAHKGGFKPQFP